MIDIIIQGINGRMGRTLCSAIGHRSDCRIAAGIDPKGLPCDIPVFTSLTQNPIRSDVLIDFSSPSSLDEIIPYCKSTHTACVICTTGFSEQQQKRLCDLSHSVPVLKSSNMSIGVNLLLELVKKANQVLGTDFDIEIVEKHHHNKEDAPSGTALMIADALYNESDSPYRYVYGRNPDTGKRTTDEIGIHSIRAGSIVGEHDVIFAGQDEILTISHSALSRAVFANGAVNAAVFLAGKSAGMYTMKDVIGL